MEKMQSKITDAEECKKVSSPVLAKRKFHANDPLIVAPSKRGNKITKLDLPKNKEPTRKALQEEKQVAKHAESKDEKQKEGRIVHARTYQMIILARALQQNTIVYLETGCGKTLISILLIKELAASFRAQKEKFLAVFMAPTVYLVMQQKSVLEINLDLRVDCFYGAKGVDYWSDAMWKEQVDENEVLVMTPMVFLDALRHGFLKLESFQLLIFDECHQAQKQHPYAKIMREFYHDLKSHKPRIFGMTASPVTSKGVASTQDSAKQMQQLEQLLDAKVYTLEDKRELEQFVPTPVQKIRWFLPPKHSFEFVSQELNKIKSSYEVKYAALMLNTDGYKDVEELAKKLWKKIRKLHGCLLYSLEELGLWCAYESANCLLKKITTDLTYGEVEDKEVQNSKEMFLKESLEALHAFLQQNAHPINSIDDGLEAVEKGLFTSKVLVLINCLLGYKNVENLRCIVFVERVVTAMVLAKILSQIGCLSFLSCSFLAGTTASLDIMGKKQQQSTLAQFHSGMINVLVATDVAEEGLDVQRCRSVIRFDLSKTVRSYIQSRGRARMPGSDYIIFLEKDNKKQHDQLSDLIQSEESMRDQALNRTHYSVLGDKIQIEDMAVFQVEKTGATVSIDSSISLVTRFCSNLPGDKYYKPQPEFVYEKIEGDDVSHVCKLILPPNGPFRELIGPPKRSRNLAKQSVCLEACKMLHAMGQLTDHLIPVIDVEKLEEEEVMNLCGKNVAGAGTNKRKELHGTASTDDLVGDWINSMEDVLLHAYLICFEFCQEEEDPYVDFVLLLKAAIDNDIANTEFPLYLTNGRKATVKFFDAGTYTLRVDQLKDAKEYHQLIFNGMFGKLIKRLNKPEGQIMMRNVLASQSALNEMWNPSQLYLLLPLIPGKLGEETEEIPIDWKAIRDTAVAASVFSYSCSTQGSSKSRINSDSSDRRKSMHDKDVLQMACGSCSVSKLKGMAVVTIHTGRIYSVIDVLDNKNADCPIEGAQDSVYSSYSHYFAVKYKKILEYPEQPLLQVKQSHRIHNLLTQDMADSKKKRDSTEKSKKTVFVELPPELCLCTGISNAVIRTLYLFPSVFHRFNALLQAGQLRRTIVRAMPQCMPVEGMVVMQALTTLRCLEGFSFEALELLGDSFLKYAVSRYLYLVYDKKHEGQLSNRRSRVICNEKLHHLAMGKQLPSYIRDEPFQPDCWTAPGMLSVKSVKCKCNLENLAGVGKSYDKGDEQTSSVFRIGKACSKGHRWICSKTVSDAVEALIGAFILCGHAGPALGFMKWIGMDIDFDLSLYKHARDRCNVHPRVLNGVNIAGIEAQLGYVFWNKALLVEALTHASQQDPYEERGCYQRLEFLGDAVLDFLITWHLFSAHPGLSPGVLSDLRSAAVNNECFARSAVKHNLQRYLRHGSGELLSQITSFVKAVGDVGNHQLFGWEGVRGPKVLGDLVESIAGAILVDSGFDLDRVWSVMERILSPLVTPSTLPLHPVRELHELSQSKGFTFIWKKTQNNGKLYVATGEVDVGNEVISETAVGQLKKTAKKDAAQQILCALKKRGICHPRWELADQIVGIRGAASTPVRVIQASEKRVFDGDVGGSDEKRRRFSGGEIFDDHGFHCREAKLMDTPALNELDPMIEESKDSSLDESSIKARMPKSAENTKSFTKVDGLNSQEDRKSCIMSGENKLDITDSLPQHNPSATADEQATSINLKMPFSKSEDETTSANYDGSSSMAQPSAQSLSNADMINKLDTTVLFKALRIKGVRLVDSSDYSIKKITEKGCGRSILNEFCMTNKWPAPVYELLTQDGKAHTEKFIFSAAVDGPHGLIKHTSEPMSRKNDAKDNAAVKVLLALDRKFSA